MRGMVSAQETTPKPPGECSEYGEEEKSVAKFAYPQRKRRAYLTRSER